MRSIVILVVGIFVGFGGALTVFWKVPQARAFASGPNPIKAPSRVVHNSTMADLTDPSAPHRFYYLLGGAYGTVDRCGVPDKFVADFELGRAFREARLSEAH